MRQKVTQKAINVALWVTFFMLNRVVGAAGGCHLDLFSITQTKSAFVCRDKSCLG